MARREIENASKFQERDAINANFKDLYNNVTSEEAIKEKAFAVNVEGGLNDDIIIIDGDKGNFFDIYLNRPTTRIPMPINLVNGETYRFQVRQDPVGGRMIKWGTEVTNTGITCRIAVIDGAIRIELSQPSEFDWSQLSVDKGRESMLQIDVSDCTHVAGLNAYNLDGVEVISFSETSGAIYFNHPFPDSAINTEELEDVTINYYNNFFFTDEGGDNWIGQFPFGVTQFTFYSTTGGASGLLTKTGVFSNNSHAKASVRQEESFTDDFIMGNDDGSLNWREMSGNDSSVGVSSAYVDSNHFGMIDLTCDKGAGATGETVYTQCAFGTDMFILDSVRASISGTFRLGLNAGGEDGVSYYFGWCDSQRFYQAFVGVYFKLVAENGVSNPRLYCVYCDGTEVLYDTEINIPVTEWFNLHIGIPPNGSTIHFSVNDVVVYELDKSWIDFGTKMTCGMGSYFDYVETPLAEKKQLIVDTFNLKYRLNSDRI